MRSEETGICRYFLIGEREMRKKSKSERESHPFLVKRFAESINTRSQLQ